MSLVSIIIPAYNAEQYLARCLDSVIDQTYKNIEILLINDGSTDATAHICDEYARQDNRIKVFHNDNQGVSMARNCGIDNSTGTYLLFIDSDDYVMLNYVETLVKSIEKDRVDMAVCGIREIIDSKHKVRLPRGKITGGFEKDYFNIVDFLCVPIAKIYVNRIIQANNLRFLQELNYAEDEIFNLSYYNNIKRYCFIDEPLYVYDHHQGSLSDKKRFRERRYLQSYVKKLRIEKALLDKTMIYKKEQIIGEQGIRAILYMSSINNYRDFKDDAKSIREHLYRNWRYDKISKIIFAALLNLEIYWPLYLVCKLRNYLD